MMCYAYVMYGYGVAQVRNLVIYQKRILIELNISRLSDIIRRYINIFKAYTFHGEYS